MGRLPRLSAGKVKPPKVLFVSLRRALGSILPLISFFPEAPQEHDPFTYGEGGGHPSWGSGRAEGLGLPALSSFPLQLSGLMSAILLSPLMWVSDSFRLHLPLRVSHCLSVRVSPLDACPADPPSPSTSQCLRPCRSPSPRPVRHPPLLPGLLSSPLSSP